MKDPLTIGYEEEWQKSGNLKHSESADLLRKSLLPHVWRAQVQKPYHASMNGFWIFCP